MRILWLIQLVLWNLLAGVKGADQQIIDETPVDGAWTTWAPFTECSEYCGGGVQEIFRSCTNPAPANGGEECYGPVIITKECNTFGCPIDGKWGEWGQYDQCTRSCGGGFKQRVRYCNNPTPVNNGQVCEGEGTETAECNVVTCPVDGNWGAWKAKGSCTLSCGGGNQLYERQCDNPKPSSGGKPCRGEDKESRQCNMQSCPVDGNWGEWKPSGKCSKSCGAGNQLYERQCDNPKPSSGGKPCGGENEQRRQCNKQACPVIWSSWKPMGSCSNSCGGGTQTFVRKCNNPESSSGGTPCEVKQTRQCNNQACPVDGNWNSWKPTGSCTKTCDGGIQTFVRQCNNPKPSSGGKSCSGKDKKITQCNKQACPVDGGWSSWKLTGSCTKSCGKGVQTLVRQCNNPKPSSGGKSCSGKDKQTTECNKQPCPVDGVWSSWKPTGSCSKSCGGGIQIFFRQCNNPKPSSGGKPCSGKDKQTTQCNKQACPVDGGWSSWKPTGSCSKTCGKGIQTLVRQCNNPKPSSRGKLCSGKDKQTTQCNKQACPVDGGWSSWKPIGSCSKSCGGGIQTFSRQCNNPKPSSGGKPCNGKDKQTTQCNKQACPVDGSWSSWKPMGSCSKSCGGGINAFVRKCNNPKPSSGGKPCSGKDKQTKQCNKQACPVDGGWSSWTPMGSCSKSCGGGVNVFVRKCNNPKPSSGGRSCSGKDKKTTQCNRQACPVDGGWNFWKPTGSCSKSCGGGIQTFIRQCNNPKPSSGGKPCTGKAEKAAQCNKQACPVDGGWSSWNPMGSCSKSCDGGINAFVRKCNNPKPSSGGRPCSGKDKKTTQCNKQACPVDGSWGTWTPSGSCSASCGKGVQVYVRKCDSPKPSSGGKSCMGGHKKHKQCIKKTCLVDGNWGAWQPFSRCSSSCGTGTQRRVRYCNSPSPSGGGKYCSGSDTFVRICNTQQCSNDLDGQWGSWTPFSICSKSCGEGHQRRFRFCNNPAPRGNGRFCVGGNTEVLPCNVNPCHQQIGKWGPWKPFTTCSSSCGGGIQRRIRYCLSPPCFGSNMYIRMCNRHNC